MTRGTALVDGLHDDGGAVPHSAAVAGVARCGTPGVRRADRALFLHHLAALGGIGLGFFSGLALDALEGPVIGEHALVLSTVAFMAVWEHQRIRSKPAFQQSLIVFFALCAYEFLLFMLDAWTGHPNYDYRRWLHTFTGGLIWPIAIALPERGHSPC